MSKLYGIPVTAPAGPERIARYVFATQQAQQLLRELEALKTAFVPLTQAQYDALTEVDESKYYIIVEETL